MQIRSSTIVLGLVFAFSAAACAVDTGAPPEADGPTSAATQALGPPKRSFDVDFSGCTEMASLTPVPVANVRARVPAGYALANEANGVTFVVVRIASCAGVAIDQRPVGGGTVAQVGVNLVSPDGTGDINNYTLWYYTTSQPLFVRLRALGVDEAQWVPGIDYRYASTGPGTGRLDVTVPGRPAFTIGGPVTEPVGPVPFVANWWGDSPRGRIRMNTTIPAIDFGGATMTLRTGARSELAEVLGATTATFPIFDSYNRFAAAHMVVAYP